MILIIIREIYPAEEPDALVVIVPVDVVVLLDAVQKESSADQQRDAGKKMIVTDTTRKERTKRIVMPLADTPQKHDCRPSPEQVNSRTTVFQRPTLPVLVRARTGTGTQEHNTTVEKLLPLGCVHVCQMHQLLNIKVHPLTHNTSPF